MTVLFARILSYINVGDPKSMLFSAFYPKNE